MPSRRHSSLVGGPSAHSKKASQGPPTLRELHKERQRKKTRRRLSDYQPLSRIEDMWFNLKAQQTDTRLNLKPKDQLIELAQEASSVLKHLQADSSRSSSRKNSQTQLPGRRRSAVDFSSQHFIEILKSAKTSADY